MHAMRALAFAFVVLAYPGPAREGPGQDVATRDRRCGGAEPLRRTRAERRRELAARPACAPAARPGPRARQEREPERPRRGHPRAVPRAGAVSTDHPLATEAAAKMLRDGGNAFDAAAAAVFVLNVTQPHLAGIGGSSNIVVHVAADGRDSAIDARERAPAATTPEMFQGLTAGAASVEGFSVRSEEHTSEL